MLNSRRFDHLPILLRLQMDFSRQPKRNRPFRFEAKWVKEEQSEPLIREVWSRTSSKQNTWQGFQLKLKNCSRKLSKWSTKQRKYSARENEEKTAQLKQLQSIEGPSESETIKLLDEDIDPLLEKEDIKWRQRAKRNWY